MILRHFIPKIIMHFMMFCVFSIAYAAYPVWTFTPNSNYPPHLSINTNQTATVVYTVQNQSHKAKSLTIKPTPGIVQSLPCNLKPIGQPGSSCSLVLAITGNQLPKSGVHTGPALCEANSNGTPNANQCYRPSAADRLNITVTTPPVDATITVSPNILFLAEQSTGSVTVTNDASSPTTANNILATIPSGSGMSVQNNNCGSNLAIGANCTITFASTTQEGPTIIPIQGDNTNSVNVYAAVTDQPVISITGPAQQLRVVSTHGTPPELFLEITNDSNSIVNANQITVSDHSACPNLSVDNTFCTSLAPGATCALRLSTNTPYAPCTITISGSNTANSPTTLIAFEHLDGLVFQSNGIHGRVLANVDREFTSEWTFPSKANVPNSTSDTDGMRNTNAIVTSLACMNNTAHCAAQRCRNISADWYLPARNELQSAVFTLCPGSIHPCSFGALASTFYWTSTQWFADTNAYSVDVPDGNFGPGDKWTDEPVRCIRDF